MLLKGNKTPENSKTVEAITAMLKAKTDNSGTENSVADKKSTAKNRNNPALDRKGSETRQSQPDS